MRFNSLFTHISFQVEGRVRKDTGACNQSQSEQPSPIYVSGNSIIHSSSMLRFVTLLLIYLKNILSGFDRFKGQQVGEAAGIGEGEETF